MSLLGYIAAMAGLVSTGLGIAVWAMWLRIGDLRKVTVQAVANRDKAQAVARANAVEFDDYRRRAEDAKEELVEELETFKREVLDGIEETPNRKTRIRLRRAWIGRVLSKASSTGVRDSDEVRKDSTP